MKRVMIGLISIFLSACSPNDAASSYDVPDENASLPLPVPEQGMQLRMVKTVMPGNESYGCQLFQMPDEDMFVHEQTVQFSRGGHHVLLYKTPYDAMPAQDENGQEVDPTEVHDCSDGVTSRWIVDSVLGGSEIFDHPGMFRGLPQNVAFRLPRKTIVIMSVHYLNASSQAEVVDARMNLSTIPRHTVEAEAGLLYIDNRFLNLPPFGRSIAEMRCPIPSDVFIANLQSHMHARGVHFSAAVYDARQSYREIVYETQKWLEPPVKTYNPYLQVRAGSWLEMGCSYINNEGRGIEYGPRSSDEMCQLIGPYFPRDDRFESCMNDTREWAAVWVGHGVADGATTRSCFECASDVGNSDYVSCLFDACPTIADRASAVVRCELRNGRGACDIELNVLANAGCN